VAAAESKSVKGAHFSLAFGIYQAGALYVRELRLPFFLPTGLTAEVAASPTPAQSEL